MSLKTNALPCSRCGRAPRATSHSYCKACRAAYMRDHRKPYAALSPKERRKVKARATTNVAIKRGRLKPQPCERCGAAKAQVHHEDYRRPLDVHWLCFECHRAEHAAERERLRGPRPPGLPEGMTGYCKGCRRPVKNTIQCNACRVRKSRGAMVVGGVCPVCGVDDPRMLRLTRFADGTRILCANHAAVAGRTAPSWDEFVDKL